MSATRAMRSASHLDTPAADELSVYRKIAVDVCLRVGSVVLVLGTVDWYRTVTLPITTTTLASSRAEVFFPWLQWDIHYRIKTKTQQAQGGHRMDSAISEHDSVQSML